MGSRAQVDQVKRRGVPRERALRCVNGEPDRRRAPSFLDPYVFDNLTREEALRILRDVSNRHPDLSSAGFNSHGMENSRGVVTGGPVADANRLDGDEPNQYVDQFRRCAAWFGRAMFHESGNSLHGPSGYEKYDLSGPEMHDMTSYILREYIDVWNGEFPIPSNNVCCGAIIVAALHAGVRTERYTWRTREMYTGTSGTLYVPWKLVQAVRRSLHRPGGFQFEKFYVNHAARQKP